MTVPGEDDAMTALTAAETAASRAITAATDPLAAYQAATRLQAAFRAAADRITARRRGYARDIRDKRSLSLCKLAEVLGGSKGLAEKLIRQDERTPR